MEIFLSWLTGVAFGVIGLILYCLILSNKQNEKKEKLKDDLED